jgi:S1-C subfamily serine protease
MSIAVVCPRCHAPDSVTDDLGGREVRCRSCQAIFFAPRLAPHRGRGVPAVAVFLILGSVIGSLAVVTASTVLVVWLWKADFFRWPTGQTDGSRAETPQAPGPEQPPPDRAQAVPGPERSRPAMRLPPPPPLPPVFVGPPPIDSGPADAPLAPTNAQLPPDVLDRVKRATVYLRVTLPDGQLAQGSGFFGVEPGIILTNAHVLGMLQPGSHRPRAIEVVQNSGGKEERRYPGEVLAVDHGSDLAVLRARGPGTPPPLPVHSARNLQETQQVYILGFPLGEGLGREITVSQTSVSSLRREQGALVRVQVNGGMSPGNSGGPVVDAAGNVIGVAVAVIRGTLINFAVPGDYVHLVLNGRLDTVTVGQPYQADGGVRLPVTVSMIDPLGRLLRPAVEVWVGDPASTSRPPATTAPRAQPGDTPHEHLAMEYRNQVARADIRLPALPAGKVYWLQPTWVNGAGQSQWASANACPLAPPVERKPASLVYHHQPGSRALKFLGWASLRLRNVAGTEHVRSFTEEADFTETGPAEDTADAGTVRLEYQGYDAASRWDGQPEPTNAVQEKLRGEVPNVAVDLHVDRAGDIRSFRVDPSRAPATVRKELAEVHVAMEYKLELVTIPLPHRQVKPGESWPLRRTFTLYLRGPAFELGTADLSCTYEGIRKHDGRDEAVLTLHGPVCGAAKGREQQIGGRAEGTAVVDVVRGQVLRTDLAILLDLDVGPLRGTGTVQARLERSDGGR